MDAAQIKQELTIIKHTTQEISRRMDRELRHLTPQRHTEVR